MKTKVRNLNSTRTGNPVANQFEIMTPKGVFFQSYDSIIAFKPNKQGAKIQLDEKYWDYSRITGKYRNEFLEESKAETQRKIDNKDYLLKDLN